MPSCSLVGFSEMVEKEGDELLESHNEEPTNKNCSLMLNDPQYSRDDVVSPQLQANLTSKMFQDLLKDAGELCTGVMHIKLRRNTYSQC